MHGVDVEGKRLGIDEELVALLGQHSPIPVTYAGGATTMVRQHVPDLHPSAQRMCIWMLIGTCFQRWKLQLSLDLGADRLSGTWWLAKMLCMHD